MQYFAACDPSVIIISVHFAEKRWPLYSVLCTYVYFLQTTAILCVFVFSFSVLCKYRHMYVCILQCTASVNAI